MNDTVNRGWNTGVKVYALVLAVAVAGLLLHVGDAAWTRDDAPDDTAILQHLSVDARHLARLGRALQEGNPVAETFQATRARVATHVHQRMEQMALTAHAQDEVEALMRTWVDVDTAAAQLDGGLGLLQDTLALIAQCLQQMPAFKTDLDTLAREMTASGSAASQVYLALHQVMLMDEMMHRLDAIRAGGDNVVAEAAELAQEIETFARVLTGLQRGDAQIALRPLQGRRMRALLEQVRTPWQSLQPMLEQIAEHAPQLLAAHAAVAALERGADAWSVSETGSARPIKGRGRLPWLGWGAGVLAILSGLGLWQAMQRQRHAWMEQAAHIRHREHEAFARLLDEMGALAEGDLTIRATVSGDITSVLAEAINFAARQLGARVQALTAPLPQMASEAGQARAMTIQLSEVSQYQAQELSTALEHVQRMSASLEALLAHMADPGNEAARQATLKAAHACADAAREVAAMIDTVHMVTLRIRGEAEQAVQALDALTQTANTLREAAEGFIVPD